MPCSSMVARVSELSRFFGIVIRMYSESGAPHHSPHFHAQYQEYAASFGIQPVELLSGWLPRRQRRLVEEWATANSEALLRDWMLMSRGLEPDPIPPAR